MHFSQDYKLKHMAEMQQSVVADADTRQQLGGQVIQWEENLERLHCEQFRLRCYMASLQSGELPNPKVCLLRYNFLNSQTLCITFVTRHVDDKNYSYSARLLSCFQ